MSRNCFTCKHCYDDEYCSLFDELVEQTLSCFMWNSGDADAKGYKPSKMYQNMVEKLYEEYKKKEQ